jgi:hypothetical protein
VYCNQHRRWLFPNHLFHENLTALDGIFETQVAPPRVDVNDIIHWGFIREQFLQQGGYPWSNDPTKIYGINQIPTFFELEY